MGTPSCTMKHGVTVLQAKRARAILLDDALEREGVVAALVEFEHALVAQPACHESVVVHRVAHQPDGEVALLDEHRAFIVLRHGAAGQGDTGSSRASELERYLRA